jgi:hypothetical protein
VAEHTQAIAMLNLLVTTCETTLDTLRAADNPVDSELVADLEEMVERTRAELARLNATFGDPS